MQSHPPFDVLVQIIQPLWDSKLDRVLRIHLMKTLPLISKPFADAFAYAFSENIVIPSRKFYVQYIAKVSALPREAYLNIRCKSIHFDLEHVSYEDRHYLRLAGAWCRHNDRIFYFIGGYLAREGLFPNLKTVHVHYGMRTTDPSEQLFLFCLPKSVTTLEISYNYSQFDRRRPVVWDLQRKSPIRYPAVRGRLSTLKISNVGERWVPFIVPRWRACFSNVDSLIVNDNNRTSLNQDLQWSLDMSEALYLLQSGRSWREIGWDWARGGRSRSPALLSPPKVQVAPPLRRHSISHIRQEGQHEWRSSRCELEMNKNGRPRRISLSCSKAARSVIRACTQGLGAASRLTSRSN